MTDELAVRGHLCEGLRLFQASGGGCTPQFDSWGQTRGCDDTNSIVILFCPFCGERLPDTPGAEWEYEWGYGDEEAAEAPEPEVKG